MVNRTVQGLALKPNWTPSLDQQKTFWGYQCLSVCLYFGAATAWVEKTVLPVAAKWDPCSLCECSCLIGIFSHAPCWFGPRTLQSSKLKISCSLLIGELWLWCMLDLYKELLPIECKCPNLLLAETGFSFQAVTSLEWEQTARHWTPFCFDAPKMNLAYLS